MNTRDMPTPTRDNIIIQMPQDVDDEKVSKGGIIMPKLKPESLGDSARQRHRVYAEVIAVGKDCKEIKRGMMVMVQDNEGVTLDNFDKLIRITKESAVDAYVTL